MALLTGVGRMLQGARGILWTRTEQQTRICQSTRARAACGGTSDRRMTRTSWRIRRLRPRRPTLLAAPGCPRPRRSCGSCSAATSAPSSGERHDARCFRRRIARALAFLIRLAGARAFNADSDGGRGASLGFLDLRDRISEAGVNLASPDFEAL
eukprot:3918159-Rhodomonas_salina.1